MANSQEPTHDRVVLEHQLDQQFPTPEADKRSGGARRVSQQRSRERSVILYIGVLFAAAVLLMLLTLLMERRQTGESLNDLNQSITGLQNSMSSMQKVDQLYADNEALEEQVEELQAQLDELQRENSRLEGELAQAQQDGGEMKRLSDAMDWFWQINEAYVRGRYTTCRELFQSLRDAGLEDALPKVSITDNKRFSPYDRYMEIYDALY